MTRRASPPPIELRETSEQDAPAFLDLVLRNREFLAPFEPRRPDEWFTPEAIRAELEQRGWRR